MISRYAPKGLRKCVICGADYRPGSSFAKYCPTCSPLVYGAQSRLKAAKFRLEHPGEAKEAARKAIIKHRGYYLAKKRVYATRYWTKIRMRVLGVYSDFTYKCACCGEKELDFLAIDHIDGGGGRQRRELFGEHRTANAGSFYHWLIKNGFPTGYQVLCHNCNWSKGGAGYCVHVLRSPLVDGSTTILDQWMGPEWRMLRRYHAGRADNNFSLRSDFSPLPEERGRNEFGSLGR